MKFSPSILAAAALLVGMAAHADTLQRISSSGTVKLGYRADNGALSYAVSADTPAGFHVDVCLQVVAELEKQLGKKLKVTPVLVTAQTRIPTLISGAVDMECGATTNNASRQKEVAFATTTYVEEVRVAVRADSGITSVAQLAGKTVATTAGTTSVTLLRKHQRAKNVELKEVLAKNDVQAFGLLESGQADAYVMDGQMLATFVSGSKNPRDIRILDDVLAVEPIAIMLPKDDPAFKKLVDDRIKALMKSGELAKIYDKWFMNPIPPKNQKVGLPLSAATKKAWAEPNDRPVEQL